MTDPAQPSGPPPAGDLPVTADPPAPAEHPSATQLPLAAQPAYPGKLERTMLKKFGPEGRAFLARLPSLLEDLASRWSLTLGDPYADLSYHYVCRATVAGGTPAVLKVGVPHDEMGTESEVLRLFDGHGIVRLFQADLEAGALLMERAVPGETLVALSQSDDDRATRIGATIMRDLWRPAPDHHPFRDMQSWFKYLWKVDADLRASGQPVPPQIERAVPLTRELIDTTDQPVLLHGDLHHFNILTAQRSPYLAIDPKGHVGDRCYELYAFLVNPDEIEAPRLTRRLDILTSELDLDRARARDWFFARQVLNACWSFDEPAKFRSDLAQADLFATI